MTLNVLTETRCHQAAQNSNFLFLSHCIVVNSFKVKQVYSLTNCILNYFPPIMKWYGKIHSSRVTLLTLCNHVTLILATLAAAMTGDQQLHNNH